MKKRFFGVTLALLAALAVPVAQADFVAPPPPGGGGGAPAPSGGGHANVGGGHHSSLSWAGPAAVVAYGLCIYYQSHRGKPGRKTLYPGEAGNILMCHPLLAPLAIASIFLGSGDEVRATRHHGVARMPAKYRKLARH